MAEAIGIRIDEEFLEKIDKLSKDEHTDRSTIIRELMNLGYKDFVLDRVAKSYIEGRLTLSEAAKIAGVTLWEMEKYLVEKGFRSSYSIDDLEKELKILEGRKTALPRH